MLREHGFASALCAALFIGSGLAAQTEEMRSPEQASRDAAKQARAALEQAARALGGQPGESFEAALQRFVRRQIEAHLPSGEAAELRRPGKRQPARLDDVTEGEAKHAPESRTKFKTPRDPHPELDIRVEEIPEIKTHLKVLHEDMVKHLAPEIRAHVKAHVAQIEPQIRAHIQRLAPEIKAHLVEVEPQIEAHLEKLLPEIKAHLARIQPEIEAHIDALIPHSGKHADKLSQREVARERQLEKEPGAAEPRRRPAADAEALRQEIEDLQRQAQDLQKRLRALQAKARDSGV